MSRDVESKEPRATEEEMEEEEGRMSGSLFRSVFWVLRKREVREGEEEEVEEERRVEVVEERLEGWREG